MGCFLSFSMDALEQFVKDLLDDKLEAYMKSEPVPDNSDKDVKVNYNLLLPAACRTVKVFSIFLILPHHKKWRGYYVIPS